MRSIAPVARLWLATSLAAASCSRAGDSRAEAGHDHAPGAEPRTLQVTVWQGRFELFLEHRVLVAGEPVRFAAHVTDLERSEARSSGPVTFRFEQPGSAPVEVVAAEPARPGIYAPEVALPRAGAWKATLTIPVDGPDGDRKEERLALPDFEVFASAHDSEHAALPEPPDGISFLKEQQWKLRTRIEPVARRALREEMRVPATIAAPPSSRGRVTPPLAGRLVAAERPWPELGARVEKGEVLAFVEPPMPELIVAVAQAEAELGQARVAVEQADAALQRVRALVEQKARSPRELEEAEFAARGAKARLDGALAVKEAYARTGLVGAADRGGAALPRLALVAPIGGVVTEVNAVPGEHVGVERHVLALLDPGVVHVDVRIPEIDLGRLADPIAASLSFPGSDEPSIEVTGAGGGRLAWRDVAIDEATRTLTLHFSLPDPRGRLRIGQALVAHLTTGAASEALAVPEGAIVDEDARPVAFVQRGGETFEKRDLELGMRDRGFVEVRSGLAEGERVVVDGAYAVRLASVSTTIPAHGHQH
jgi:RND family efflux transporter MFP subunit